MPILIIIAALAIIGLGLAVYNLCHTTPSLPPVRVWRPTVAAPPSEPVAPQGGDATIPVDVPQNNEAQAEQPAPDQEHTDLS